MAFASPGPVRYAYLALARILRVSLIQARTLRLRTAIAMLALPVE